MPDEVPPSRITKYRRAARLFVFKGRTYAEMAEHMGVSEDAVVGWFEDRDFQVEIERARTQQSNELRLMVDSKAPATMEMLAGIIEDGDAHKAERIAAARLLYPETSYAKAPPADTQPQIVFYGEIPGMQAELPEPPRQLGEPDEPED